MKRGRQKAVCPREVCGERHARTTSPAHLYPSGGRIDRGRRERPDDGFSLIRRIRRSLARHDLVPSAEHTTGQLAQPLRIRFRDGAPVLQDVHRQSVHVDVDVTADLHVGAQVVARPGGLVHMAGAQPVGAKDLLALEPVEVPAGTGPCGKRLPVLQRERRQSRQLLQEKIEWSVRRVAPRPSSGPSSGRPLPWTASHCQGRYSGGPFDADADGPLAGPALAAGVCGPVRALPLRRRSPLKDGLRQEVGRDASCARCHCGPGPPPADVADSLPG